MPRTASIASTLLFLSLAACSGDDGEIKVEAASSPLTTKGGDALFSIELVDARDEGYGVGDYEVKVTPEDKDAVVVTCTLQDANTNQKLDKGDKLACVEGAENRFDSQLGGKALTVELFAKIDGSSERIGEAAWTPPK